MGNLISLLFSNTSLLISLASPAPITNTTNFPRGPYLSPDFADPAVFKTDDGRWYAYATRHPQNPQWNVPMGISEDFGEWRYSVDEGGSESDAMPILPAWVNVANAAVWAPDIAHWVSAVPTRCPRCLKWPAVAEIREDSSLEFRKADQ